MKISLDGNMVLKCEKQISNICKPLHECLEIPFFRYIKIFQDNSRIFLTNKPDVIKFFYEDEYYPLSWLDSIVPSTLQKSKLIIWAIEKLSDSKEQIQMKAELKKLFNLTDGLAYIIKSAEFVEIFNFASNKNNIYHINDKIFHRFMYYFKERAHKLLKQAHFDRIIIPVLDKKNEIDLRSKEMEALKKLPIKRFYLNENNQVHYLTSREVECLHLMIKGKSCREISDILNRSQKTINRHIENIKLKLNCCKQSQLITSAIKHRFISLNEL